MEESSSRKSSESHTNGEEQNDSRKRKRKRKAAVEENPLRTALPTTKLFCRRQLPPCTALRLDLNRKQPSNSFEANTATRDLFLTGKSKSKSKSKFQLSFLNEDEGDDDQFSSPLPQSIKERVNLIDQLIKQQGEELTRILAEQQKNLYKIIGEAARKKLKETRTELDKARVKIVELENTVRYLERLLEDRENRFPWDMNMNRRENNGIGEAASVYSSAHHQPEAVGECSRQNRIPEKKIPQCKVCGKGFPTMMLWPCHHLCLCKHCETAIQSCPCCGTPKISSSAVLFPVV